MSLFDKLLNNKCIKKLIKFFRGENKLLKAINFSFVDELFEKNKESKRGKKKQYLPSQLFKLCLEAFQKGRTSAKSIERYVREPLVKILHELNGYVSHDVISRFFISLQEVIKDVFNKLVKVARKLGIFYPGLSQVIDGTDLPTMFLSDKDAKWNYDSTAKKFYFGYGLLISIDPFTHLPVAGRLTKAKKINKEDCKEVLEQGIVLKPSAFVGDSEFDIIKILENLLLQNILLIAPYNKRNSHEELDIEFRAEQYGFDRNWMKEESVYRSEVEHSISTLKEHFHLLDFHVRGWKKVETHVMFVLCLRLLHGIATFKEGKNPRKVTLI
jgi:hypothetical protein